MTKLMIIPQLLLQKQHEHSTRTENIKCLERRILLWKEGKLDQLRKEATTLNDIFSRKYRTKKENGSESAKFAKLLKKGKVGPSLRLFQENNSRGILPLTHTTKPALAEKHPSAKVAAPNTKIEGPQLDDLEGIYEEINGLMIWKMALKAQGAAGPSGLNTDCVRTLLSKRIFGEVAVDLRKALANLPKTMATARCKDIDVLIARRLIPRDKNPGVRPIAIGEVFTRILGKCIMAVMREDVKLAAGNLQVCVGHQAGGEATIHAMKKIFKDKEVEAAVLVDATNAFNPINREAILHNIAVN